MAAVPAVWQDIAGGTIENCSVSGSVSGTVYVGGVVGAQIERFHHRMQLLCHSEGNGLCRRRGRSDELECHPDRLLCHGQRDHRNSPQKEYRWRRSGGNERRKQPSLPAMPRAT